VSLEHKMTEALVIVAPDEANRAAQTLVESILSGHVSILDLMSSMPNNDYFMFVKQTRLFMLIMNDSRILKLLLAEMRTKMSEAGVDPDNREIEKELARKDGGRRFAKLLEEKNLAISAQPSLLTATIFTDRLAQYKILLAHVERLWADACELYQRGNFPIATFLSILVIEEVGKLSNLAQELIQFDAPRPLARKQEVERSHRRKHFLGVVSGALINARLDRVLGKDKVRRILHEAESDKLEQTRQSCLYIDIRDGHLETPSERINQARARDLTVLSGELMAEILGYFPWEFERMMENVVAFERAIGLPEAKIRR